MREFRTPGTVLEIGNKPLLTPIMELNRDEWKNRKEIVMRAIITLGFVLLALVSCLTGNTPDYSELSPCTERHSLKLTSESGNDSDSIIVKRTPAHPEVLVCYDSSLDIHTYVEIRERQKMRVDLNRKTILSTVREPGVYDIVLSREVKAKNIIAVFLADRLVFETRFLGKQ